MNPSSPADTQCGTSNIAGEAIVPQAWQVNRRQAVLRHVTRAQKSSGVSEAQHLLLGSGD
jgi:hypothetical protein